MTREEAKREMLFAKREVVADSWIDKAYDVAIKALSEPERKKGRWSIKIGELAFWDVCSECGKMVLHKAPFYSYCPNCGAKMGVEHEQRRCNQYHSE